MSEPQALDDAILLGKRKEPEMVDALGVPDALFDPFTQISLAPSDTDL